MTHPAPEQLPDLLRSAIEKYRDEAEDIGGLPDDLLDALRTAGAFRLYTPRELGGFEAPPAVALDVLERLGRLDGPTAWIVWNLNMGFIAGQIDEDGVARIWQDPDPLIANSGSPGGMLPVDGGFRLTGTWKIVSGAPMADWFVLAGMTPASAESSGEGWGAGLFLCVVPRADVRILDTWDVAGMRASASHSVVADNVFVPAGMAVDFFAPNRLDDRPAYRHSSVALVYPGCAAVLIGMAQGAIDELVAPARSKSTMDGSPPAAREHVQTAVGRATAEVAAARGLLLETARDLDRAVTAGRPATDLQRAALRGAICHVTDVSRTVLTSMYELGSSTPLYRANRLGRIFRDGMAAAQAANLATTQYSLAGRIVLGQPANVPFI
ncbi:acyl-CoA dehydrogenase family protein [Catenuloplanes japonicus]|uniref:acyl-CoA dehydrogenase family protein n=1 Tax=Catenuloplanes japonicus TaxID=33876 RepID=UPI000527CBB9|nr:acyl-CoA dehydrogenase family protein [Catenuloplanes japonicus]